VKSPHRVKNGGCLGQCGIAITHTHLADVRNLTGDNEAQQHRIGRIEHLASEKLAELASRIEEVRTGNKPSPQGLRSGKDVMDAIRAEIADMRVTEDRLFEARTKIANRFILIATAMDHSSDRRRCRVNVGMAIARAD
jgi:CHASE3 domain sensor protein